MSESPDYDEEIRAEVRLSLVAGVGPILRKRLVERFGSAAQALAAAPSAWREVDGIGPKLARALAASDLIDVDAELGACRAGEVALLSARDDRFPRMLHEIPDPPGIVYLRGTLLPRDQLSVAIVGSRHATPYGLAQAERLAGSLARAGLTVVSGLARGIDAAAHRGALAAGGRTIAVLGSGVLNIYPPEHGELADAVRAQGALLSESPPRGEPLAGLFPQRNRIISAISLGVIVVEAADRSGALITARHAMEQGRDVFALPGRVDSRMSRGPHRLIRDGAKLVETAEDVLEELGPLVEGVSAEHMEQKVQRPAELLLNEIEQRVLASIGSDTTSIDEVISASGLSAAQVLATLSVLEVRRLVRRVSGNSLVRL